MLHLHDDKIKFLEEKAGQLRLSVSEALIEADSGDLTVPLGVADIFSAMYFHVLHHDPKNPDWADRDRFVVSHRNMLPILCLALADSGYFSPEDFNRVARKKFQFQDSKDVLPGIDFIPETPGSGLPRAVGISVAAGMDNKKNRTYCIMSDEELGDGDVYEAMLFAGKLGHKASNLTLIIDRNNIQAGGYTEDIMPLEPLMEKFESFNWHVLSIDGHNMDLLVSAVSESRAVYEQPTVIVAHTTPGKGVDFMENDYRWYGVSLGKGPEDVVSKSDQAEEALRQLRGFLKN